MDWGARLEGSGPWGRWTPKKGGLYALLTQEIGGSPAREAAHGGAGPRFAGTAGAGVGGLQLGSHQEGHGGGRLPLLACGPPGPHLCQLQASSMPDPATTWTSSRLRSSHLLYWTPLSWVCMLRGLQRGAEGELRHSRVGRPRSGVQGPDSGEGSDRGSMWGCI